jgi:hypothetical protein
MWLLRLDIEIFDFFQENLQDSLRWGFESRPLSTKQILANLYLQI